VENARHVKVPASGTATRARWLAASAKEEWSKQDEDLRGVKGLELFEGAGRLNCHGSSSRKSSFSLHVQICLMINVPRPQRHRLNANISSQSFLITAHALNPASSATDNLRRKTSRTSDQCSTHAHLPSSCFEWSPYCSCQLRLAPS
jgi:hypothetical protein